VGLIKVCLNETYSTLCIGKSLFRQLSYLELGVTLSSLSLKSAFEYVIRRVQENEEGLNFNGAHQPFAYADNFNIVAENINNVQGKKTSSIRCQ
jgi:hypothetical protein